MPVGLPGDRARAQGKCRPTAWPRVLWEHPVDLLPFSSRYREICKTRKQASAEGVATGGVTHLPVSAGAEPHAPVTTTALCTQSVQAQEGSRPSAGQSRPQWRASHTGSAAMLTATEAGMKEAQTGGHRGPRTDRTFMNRGLFAHRSARSHTKTEGLTAPRATTSKPAQKPGSEPQVARTTEHVRTQRRKLVTSLPSSRVSPPFTPEGQQAQMSQGSRPERLGLGAWGRCRKPWHQFPFHLC